jgi:hypothetical protein
MQNNTKHIVLTHSNLSSMLEVYIACERLRQAQLSFNLAFTASTISALVGLIGAGLLLSGQLSEGSATAAIGLTSSVCCSKMTKDANDRLDRLSKRYK